MNNRITEKDYIKAVRRANRMLELEMFGKQIRTRTALIKSKKTYTRKEKHKESFHLDLVGSEI